MQIDSRFATCKEQSRDSTETSSDANRNRFQLGHVVRTSYVLHTFDQDSLIQIARLQKVVMYVCQTIRQHLDVHHIEMVNMLHWNSLSSHS